MPMSREERLQYNRDYNARRPRRDHGAERRRYRLEALARYGGKCVCCGEDEEAFLCFDHVNGDRRSDEWTKSRSTYLFHLARHPLRNDIQILCANCNLAKERPGGCPHQATGLDST